MPYLAILISPFVSLGLFANLPGRAAIVWAVILPYLFLPEAFAIRLPGLPDIDKTAIITIGLILGAILYAPSLKAADRRDPVRLASPLLRGIIVACLAVFLLGTILTVMNNGESLRFGPVWLPGLRAWDSISFIGGYVLFLTPFVFAWRLLATPDAHRTLLRVIVITGLVYTILMLIEMRLSPQFHRWIYGYHQHSFLQHIRDGYRPMVFLQHGLWVGFYTFTAVIAAAALWKSEGERKWLWAGLWLFVVLMLSENLAAFAIAVMMLVLLFAFGARVQLLIVAVIAAALLVFPVLRQAQLVPTDRIVALAEKVSVYRAQSIEFRFDNEDELLDKALRKPLSGWGSYGRDRIYDPDTGKDLTVSEGRWIQTLGIRGWIGYVSLFGLLTIPLVLLRRVRRRKEVPPQTIALALISAGNLIYMIPNSTLTPVGLLIFGAVAGFVQYDSTRRETGSEEAPRRADRPPRYTRFPEGASPQGRPATRADGLSCPAARPPPKVAVGRDALPVRTPSRGSPEYPRHDEDHAGSWRARRRRGSSAARQA